jgi:peroxiredoxin (alkyl hydroperoxide reductase subunit C)
MKKAILLLLLVGFSLNQLWAQEDRNFKIPLIGDTAPSFTAETTNGTLEFPSSLGKKWKVLFSHPQDYTPVCSSELLELANMQKEFDDLNVKLVVVSTDKLATHVQWVKALEELKYKNRVTQKIKFPLVDDYNQVVSKLYGMIHPSSNSTKNVRGVYIIDSDNIIQSISFYPMTVGRNMEELKRSVIALQTAKEGVASTPANWVPGEDILVPYKLATPKENEAAGLYDVAWFMTFKKSI